MKSDGRGEEENEEESSGQDIEVGSNNRRKTATGGVSGEEKLGGQEEEEGSKRRRRIGVCGGPLEGERADCDTAYRLKLNNSHCSSYSARATSHSEMIRHCHG